MNRQFNRPTLALVWITVLGWVLAFGSGVATAQPSFDCSKAGIPAEFAVCGNAMLQSLDRDLDAAFRRALSTAGPAGERVLRQRQRQWLTRRNRCRQNVQCLAGAYRAALAAARRSLTRGAPATADGIAPSPPPFAARPDGAITEAGDIGVGMLGDSAADTETVVVPGTVPNTGPVPAEPAPASRSGALYDHNGSEMLVEERSGAVTIVYRNPKSSLRRLGVSSGTLLFEGTRRGSRLSGTARTFRSGCEPARYAVTGTAPPDRGFALRGTPPRRADGSCRIVGTNPSSSNALLGFRFLRRLY